MIRMIGPEELFTLPAPLFIDVRSESEFAEDHIPGALNMPVFNDQERAEVGTAYHQSGPEEARRLGLKILAPKLPELVDRVSRMSADRQVVLYCWRGGSRSHSLAVILDLMNIPVYRLQGGYKQFRRLVHDFFLAGEFSSQMVVLHGLTGTGKTEILKAMDPSQVGVVDLEGLANHRGSVFGSVGLGDQPPQKLFESLLWYDLQRQAGHPFLVMECESKRIGRLVLPATLVQAMHDGRHLLIYDGLDGRIRRLQAEYDPAGRKEELAAILMKLKGRLGSSKIQALQADLEQEDFASLIRQLLVEYYDPLYAYPDHPDTSFALSVYGGDSRLAAQAVTEFLKNDEQG